MEDQRQLYNDSFVNCSKQFKQSGKMADTFLKELGHGILSTKLPLNWR